MPTPLMDDGFESAFTHAPIAMAVAERDGSLRANAAFQAMLDAPLGDALRRVVEQLVDRAWDRPPRRRPVERRLRAAGVPAAWVELSLRVVPGGGRVLVQVVDVTARREREERLQALAEREPLTNLWNRRRFDQELVRQLARCLRHDERATLVVLDVDGLKRVNDELGHKAGDAVIRHVARALERRVRASDAVARIGGDEFAVLLAETDGEEALHAAEQLCHDVAATPVETAGTEVSVAISAGTVGLSALTVDAESAFAAADAALYAAKEAGGGQVAAALPRLAPPSPRWSRAPSPRGGRRRRSAAVRARPDA